MRFFDRLVPALSIFGALLVLCGVAYIGFIAIDAGNDFMALKSPTAAMEPTILTGDDFSAQRLPRGGPPSGGAAVARGDVVVHEFPPDPSKRFVKRVVGLPGDTLAMRRGVLFVNGRAPAESYAWHAEPVGADSADSASAGDFEWQREFLTAGVASSPFRPTRNEWGPIVVPPDHYFVLGDNRDNSLDSRYWGFVSGAQVVARARRVYFSQDPATGRIRWSRFGHRLQ